MNKKFLIDYFKFLEKSSEGNRTINNKLPEPENIIEKLFWFKYIKVNQIFLASYFKALKNQRYVRLKRICPTKVYFNEEKTF